MEAATLRMQVGTATLVAQVVQAEVPKVLYLSSTAVYGNATEASSEAAETHPIDAFGAPHPHPPCLY